MANLNGFNANEVEPTTAFEPLPAVKYLVANIVRPALWLADLKTKAWVPVECEDG